MNLSYICLYADYDVTLEPFSFEERGRLLTAMLQYLKTGEEPEFVGNERFIWPTLREQINRDQAAYEKRVEQNKENGKKGGRPKKEETKKTDGFSEKPKKPKEKEKEKKKENKNNKNNKNEKDNENDNKNENERENAPLIAPDSEEPVCPPPTLTEVTRHIDTHNFIFVDPNEFYVHYQMNGWKQKDGQPVRDWKKEIALWNTTVFDGIRRRHSVQRE